MENLLRELRHAARALSKRPGFTLIAVFTLALGIGATTAIFSVVNAVLLEPLPYPEPGKLVRLWEVNADGGTGRWGAPNFLDLRERSESLEAMAAYGSSSATVIARGDAVQIGGSWVSEGFFETLRARFAIGRGFLPEESRNDARVVVIGHGFWQREFGGDANALGETLMLDGEPYVIVGVLADDMAYPAGSEYWIPVAPSPAASRTAHSWDVIGRLAADAGTSAARRELAMLAAQIHAQLGNDTDIRDVSLVPLRTAIVGNAQSTLLILLGAAACLLLIACANVANLLLARAMSRDRELAVRLALGARRGRLVTQFLAESLVLSVSGGVLGVLFAAWIVRVLLDLAPDHLPRVAEAGVDGTVLLFALCVSVATAVGVGLATAWRATGAEHRHSLAGNQRAGTGGTMSRRVRGVLAAAQIALTLVLLTGAGLLGRSFLELLDVDPGYRSTNAVVMEVPLPWPEDDAGAQRLLDFQRNLLDRLAAIPGVAQAGSINAFPLKDSGANGGFLVVNRPGEVQDIEEWKNAFAVSRTGYAEYRIASPGYFETMEIPLLAGRMFDERDVPDAPHAALISKSLAEKQWPGESPLGKLINFGNMDGDVAHAFTVVGIVGDVRDRSLASAPQPTFYACSCQRVASLGGGFSVVLTGTIADGAIISSARQAVNALDPGVPVRFRTLEQVFATSLADSRFSMTLLGVFGIAALLLAAAGIYGVVAYLVTQQAREFGLRMALGSTAGGVQRLVLRRSAMLATTGLAAGLVVAFATTRVLASLLYAVSPADPLVFAGVALLLAAVAMIASYIPARRATQADPMSALREE